MNDKQIKEIAKDIPSDIVAYDGKSYGLHLYIEQKQYIAKKLLQQGYRKIPEDSVVLTKERYEYLTCSFENFDKIMEDVKKLERKETAREVLDKVYDFGQGFFIERSFMEEDELYGILDEVKKLFLNVVGIKE